MEIVWLDGTPVLKSEADKMQGQQRSQGDARKDWKCIVKILFFAIKNEGVVTNHQGAQVDGPIEVYQDGLL
eukprot:4282101-Prorocentrum_lima.AAC.1